MSDPRHKSPPGPDPQRFDFERLAATQLYRPSRRPPYRPRSGRGWAPAVETLLAAGYSFLAETFDAGGCLFRGVYATAQGEFLPADAVARQTGSELSTVEQVMGVSFVSHELSDALYCAGDAPAGTTAAVAVLPASLFETQRRGGAAAVLAIGDSGLVFRYPFLTTPPALADCRLLITCGPAPAALQQLSSPPVVSLPAGGPNAREPAARQALATHGLQAAAPRPCAGRPDLTTPGPS